MADIIEIDKQIKEDELSIEDMKGQAYSIVRRMTKTDCRTLIEWFYLNGVSMIDVAEKMHLSERSAYYLKDDALEEFGSIM